MAKATEIKAGLILITRPEDDAADYAADLQAESFATLTAPMLTIRPATFAAPDLSRFKGLLFTSANAVRIFAEHCAGPDVPVFTVGAQTARAASQAGFTAIHTASGGARELAEAVIAHERAASAVDTRSYLHVRGDHVARPLHLDLQNAGIGMELLVIYHSEKISGLDRSCIQALENGEITVVTFFSRRTAEVFIECVEQAGLTPALASIKALCLSQSVLKCVRSEYWLGAYAAARPDRAAMLELLKTACR